jgi:hypothetical protein
MNTLLHSEAILDVRILERFTAYVQPIYEYARFILREMIERPGPLISELLLSARLGISITDSKQWNLLLQQLDRYKYLGPFSNAWKRWWAAGVEKEWWPSLKGVTTSLSILTGEERVEIIKNATGIKNLKFADPIKANYHSRYYTICEYYQKPLDPIDGIIIKEKEPEPWQDRRYISLDVALERRSEKCIPHPTEIPRLKELKSRIKKNAL